MGAGRHDCVRTYCCQGSSNWTDEGVSGGRSARACHHPEGKKLATAGPSIYQEDSLVLFTSYESADVNDGKIEVVDLKTGRRKQVHSGGTYARYAASGHLLYVQRNTLWAAPFDLGRLEITAKPVPVLKDVMTNGAGGAHYDTSPDGTLIHLSGQEAPAFRRRLYWAEPGGKRTTISERLRSYFWPAISPDGKRLAVTILEQDNWDVWIHDLERDSQTRLTFHEGADVFPSLVARRPLDCLLLAAGGHVKSIGRWQTAQAKPSACWRANMTKSPHPSLRMGSICSLGERS